MKHFDISVPHFYNLEYNEGKKKMVIDIDFRESFIYLDESLITYWEPPFEKEEITEKQKIKILKNIYRYLSRYYGSRKIVFKKTG